MAFWILKSEPSAYSFEDLLREKKTSWDGVRNYQARNNLRQMKPGDLALIYHSVGPKQIVGIAEVTSNFYPDKSADGKDWVAVDIIAKEKLNRAIGLSEIKEEPRLKELSLVKQSRLSVCPVSKDEWETILQMAEK